MYVRPTTMANAMVSAVIKAAEKVDHQTGTGPWINRRIILNTERKGFGLVNEFDHSPHKQPKESK